MLKLCLRKNGLKGHAAESGLQACSVSVNVAASGYYVNISTYDIHDLSLCFVADFRIVGQWDQIAVWTKQPAALPLS